MCGLFRGRVLWAFLKQLSMVLRGTYLLGLKFGCRNLWVLVLRFKVLGIVQGLQLGPTKSLKDPQTRSFCRDCNKGHEHNHFTRISRPSWASIIYMGYLMISLSHCFLIVCSLEALEPYSG